MNLFNEGTLYRLLNEAEEDLSEFDIKDMIDPQFMHTRKAKKISEIDKIISGEILPKLSSNWLGYGEKKVPSQEDSEKLFEKMTEGKLEGDLQVKKKLIHKLLYFYSENDEKQLPFNKLDNYQNQMKEQTLIEKLQFPQTQLQLEQFPLTPYGIMFRPKQELGVFNFGSTVVLAFAAPTTARFAVKEGEKVKLGQPLLK
jgi:hypothetical protein